MHMIPKWKALFDRISSFTYLNVTQFLGALNDNIYKLLIVYFLIQMDGHEMTARIMAFTGATFVLPFLLFSAPSGTLADRFSKRNIIVLTKLLELVITLFGVLIFVFESKFGAYAALFLIATQSAIFGPSKYGIIPELVASEKISKANGLMTSFTFLAIILGTFFASFIVDITNYNFIFASVFSAFISLIGLIASFCIEYTPPSGSIQPFNIMFLREIFSSIKIAAKNSTLLTAILGSSFFLFLGGFMQLNIIPFAMQSLNLSEVQGGYLFLVSAIGIGSGSLIAGKISGKMVELALVPLAGFGVVISCYFLDYSANSLLFVVPLVVILGMFGGIFQIPLDSYIQIASPNKYRGQIIAATNFLSFFGVLCSSGLVWLLGDFLKLPADKGFSIMGTFSLIVTLAILYQYYDYVTRFTGMLLSRLHFKTTFIGVANIPEEPAIYVCHHNAWNDTLLLLGAQRRRMRFLIEDEKSHTKWLRKLYGLLRVILIPAPETLEENQPPFEDIKQTLAKGISVCLFVSNPNIQEEIIKLQKAYTLKNPLVSVAIVKGKKEKQSRLFGKLHVPAEISFSSA